MDTETTSTEQASEPKAKRGGVMLTRADLDVVCATVKSEPRCPDALHITNERTEASGRHWMLRLDGPRPESSDDFPVTDATRGPFAETVDLLLPSDAAREMAKALPKKSSIPILGCALVAEQNGHILGVTTDLETANARQIRKVDAQFPPTDRVMPQSEPVASVTLSAHYLKTIAEYVIKHGDAGSSHKQRIAIEFRHPEHAVKMTTKASDGRRIVVVLMPMRD